MKFLHIFILILKKIQTRPTKYFIFLVLSIIGLFSLAYMHNYNIVYLMMFFIFSLAGASSILGRLNLYELEASVLVAQDFFANTSSSYSLNIYNASLDRDSFSFECGDEKNSVYINELKALHSSLITLDFFTNKRGFTQLPALRLASFFPLPHEVLYFYIDLDTKILVYPEPKGESLEKFSSRHKNFFGEYDDFQGIRSFKEGESLSLIYWPSLAKGQELMAKDFEMINQSRHLHFYFNTAADSDEKRLSQLCLWVLECKGKKINFSIHFPFTVLDSSQRSYHEILEFLATY